MTICDKCGSKIRYWSSAVGAPIPGPRYFISRDAQQQLADLQMRCEAMLDANESEAAWVAGSRKILGSNAVDHLISEGKHAPVEIVVMEDK